MSIKYMSEVWKYDLTPTQKLVMLALADAANDSGECYPSITTLVEKTGVSKSSVLRVLKEMENCGILTKKKRGGRSSLYHITSVTMTPPVEDSSVTVIPERCHHDTIGSVTTTSEWCHSDTHNHQ